MKTADLFCILECTSHMLYVVREIFKLDENVFFVYEFDYEKEEQIIQMIDKKELKEILKNFKKVDKNDMHNYKFKITFKQYEDVRL